MSINCSQEVGTIILNFEHLRFIYEFFLEQFFKFQKLCRYKTFDKLHVCHHRFFLDLLFCPVP